MPKNWMLWAVIVGGAWLAYQAYKSRNTVVSDDGKVTLTVGLPTLTAQPF